MKDEDHNRFVVNDPSNGELLEPVAGTDRRLAVGLVILFVIGAGGSALVNATGSWWWVVVAFSLGGVTFAVVFVLDARERQWSLARQYRAFRRTSRSTTQTRRAERKARLAAFRARRRGE